MASEGFGMLILVILIGGLEMIWSSYEFFGPGGLTNSASCDILRAKTAAPPNISDTFSDILGNIGYKVNNSRHIPYMNNNFSLYIHHKHIFFITFNNYTKSYIPFRNTSIHLFNPSIIL